MTVSISILTENEAGGFSIILCLLFYLICSLHVADHA
jgi:hypothetical protein